jgi:uncharacterized protein (TIGR02246 family)
MSPLEVLTAEREVRALVLASARLVDAQDWRGFADLFAADGELTRPDGSLMQGREAVFQAYAARDPDRLTQHVITSHEVEIVSAERARSRCLVLLWSGKRSDALSPKGRAADAAQQLGEFVDTLIHTPQGWRIARREARFMLHRA